MAVTFKKQMLTHFMSMFHCFVAQDLLVDLKYILLGRKLDNDS